MSVNKDHLKILMLNHEFPPVGGGASPVTFELSKQLIRMGHRVDVVTMHYGKLPRFETIDGVNIYRTPAIRKKADICRSYELATYLPGALFKTISLAKHEKYDIIHCHFIVPGGPLAWIVSKRTKIPFIITCHGSDVPGYNPDRFGLMHRFLNPAWQFLVKKTPQLTAPSDSLRQLILKNCAKAEVIKIPNGLEADFYNPGKKEKSILMCSRMFPRKGLQYAIEAVRDMTLDWQLNIIGEGPYLPELKKMAQGSKTAVKFWGWLDKKGSDFSRLFNTSSIFVFTSKAESFGMVIAEAMAAGNAVIASDIPAHKEVLGDSGIYVEIENPAQIRNQLQRLIDDETLRKDLQRQARERVVEQFSWPVVAEQFINCYKNTIEGRG